MDPRYRVSCSGGFVCTWKNGSTRGKGGKREEKRKNISSWLASLTWFFEKFQASALYVKSK